MDEFREWDPDLEQRPPDPQQESAVDALRAFFETRRDQVFTSRQIEVLHEKDYYHWVTNRGIRQLEAEGFLRSEVAHLSFGGSAKVIWHRAYRYPRRSITALIELVEEYSDPNIGGALGLHAEYMVLEGFARHEFVMRGREVRSFLGAKWTETEHDLDFIFERDGIVYGVEVKNTLAYMDYDEFKVKIRLCHSLELKPVVVARMLPKHWIDEIRREGGFALIIKFQLYPWAHRDLARRVREGMGLPVDSPRALAEGTMNRFVGWHMGPG